MNPFEYQRELMSRYEESNKKAHDRIVELVATGVWISLTGSIIGPYTTSQAYYMTNSECLTVVSPSSLHWVHTFSVMY